MAKKAKTKRVINHEEIAGFLKRASDFQERSRCACPIASRQNSAIARKYLFYVIDELAG